MTEKLWGGRFTKSTDKNTDHFHSSISFDKRLYKQDIKGSIAHCEMLIKQKIIPETDGQKIISGLNEITQEIEEGKIVFSKKAEDIHMNIESILIEKIGGAGKRLHTGRSRNDQVALDTKMYVMEEGREIAELIKQLICALNELSKEHKEVVMPGYTHLQRAQPITFSHHLLAYCEMFKRDFGRISDFLKRTDEMPLGAGALAASTYELDREYVKDLLGFSRVTANSLDAVSDRDFCIELLSALSILMMHLSRFCEEIVLWASFEFKFIEIDDAFATGSSIMPQKKNPDMAELIRGKTGRVYGGLMTLLTVMKGLPLAYNKDMQEDKEAVFDAIDTVKMCLPVFINMISSISVYKENMENAAKGGFINATDAADYLVKKGAAFRDAHEIIGKLVLYCIDNNKPLDGLSLAEFKSFSDYFDDSVYDAISLKTCVNSRKVFGGPSVQSVNKMIEINESWLNM